MIRKWVLIASLLFAFPALAEVRQLEITQGLSECEKNGSRYLCNQGPYLKQTVIPIDLALSNWAWSGVYANVVLDLYTQFYMNREDSGVVHFNISNSTDLSGQKGPSFSQQLPNIDAVDNFTVFSGPTPVQGGMVVNPYLRIRILPAVSP